MSDYNKLRDALLAIRDECASHKNNCIDCPLAIDDHFCGVTSEKMIGMYDYKKKPQYWSIPTIHLMSKNEENS